MEELFPFLLFFVVYVESCSDYSIFQPAYFLEVIGIICLLLHACQRCCIGGYVNIINGDNKIKSSDDLRRSSEYIVAVTTPAP